MNPDLYVLWEERNRDWKSKSKTCCTHQCLNRQVHLWKFTNKFRPRHERDLGQIIICNGMHTVVTNSNAIVYERARAKHLST